jgi:MFS family permease
MAPPQTHEEILPVPNTVELELAKIPTPTEYTTNVAKNDSDPDPFLVAFDPHYDEENPLDWPSGRRWMVTDVLSASGFCRIMVSTIMAPALPTIAAELAMNSAEAAMSMSIYLLATAFGPLIIGPLSEIYGRRVVLHASNIWFVIWNIACGFAHTKGTLITARFMTGFGASAMYALGGGVMGDIWRPEQRGRTLGMYLLIPLLAAAVGKFSAPAPYATQGTVSIVFISSISMEDTSS